MSGEPYEDGLGKVFVNGELRLADLEDVGWKSLDERYCHARQDAHRHQFLEPLWIFCMDIGDPAFLVRLQLVER